MNTIIDLTEYRNELLDLESRARRIDYKNVIPRLPKKPTESTLRGFKKRLSNWKNGLVQLEKERLNETIIQTTDVIQTYLKK